MSIGANNYARAWRLRDIWHEDTDLSFEVGYQVMFVHTEDMSIIEA